VGNRQFGLVHINKPKQYLKTNIGMTQGEFFNRYKYDRTKDRIGGGGFGNVYKVFDTIENETVALKIAEVKQGQESLSLLKEVELASSLKRHVNIARYTACHRFDLPNGHFDFGILQYYPLGNLSQLVKSKKLKYGEKEQIAKGVISGIQHLHSNNIVHRDLKSANILIAEGYHGEYVPKIADFGLSKQVAQNENSYFSNSFAGGSLLYVAPEQLEGKELRKNVDLWSLGVVLYELFVGETPFRANVDDGSETARAEIIQKIRSASIPLIVSNIPEPWQEVIKVCLVVDPAKRVKSVEDVMDLFDLFKNGAYKESPSLREKDKIVDKFDSIKDFSKLNISELHTYLRKNETSLLIVWIDESNIYLTQNKLDKDKRVVTLVINEFLGHNVHKKIEDWFSSLNWKIYRTLSIESAIAMSIKDIENENEYFFSIAYGKEKRNVSVEVGDGVIEMCKSSKGDENKLIVDFNHNNIELWVSFALKGLLTQFQVLDGQRNNLLLLDYFGYEIKFAKTTIVNYTYIKPFVMIKSVFKNPQNITDIIEISIGGINGTEDTILQLDCKKYWKKITYDDAVLKDNYFFICNAQGQYLTSIPFFYDEKSEDNKYYLFKEFSQSYIPRDCLRLVDINGQLIDKENNVMFVDIKIDINANRVIKIHQLI